MKKINFLFILTVIFLLFGCRTEDDTLPQKPIESSKNDIASRFGNMSMSFGCHGYTFFPMGDIWLIDTMTNLCDTDDYESPLYHNIAAYGSILNEFPTNVKSYLSSRSGLNQQLFNYIKDRGFYGMEVAMAPYVLEYTIAHPGENINLFQTIDLATKYCFQINSLGWPRFEKHCLTGYSNEYRNQLATFSTSKL